MQAYLGVDEDGAGQAEELPLSQGEDLAPLRDLGPQPAQPLHGHSQVALVQHRPQGLVREAARGVQVLPHRAAEQEGVLGDDGQPGPEGTTAPSEHRHPALKGCTGLRHEWTALRQR